MAVIAEITFGSSRLAALARGLDKEAFDANPPTTVEEGEEFVRSRIIKRLKLAYKRGLKSNHEDAFVDLPFDDILS